MDQRTYSHPELEREAQQTPIPAAPPEMAPPSQVAASRQVQSQAQPSSTASLAQATESAKRFAQEHPWVVVGAAAGLGVALGAGSRRVPHIDREHLAQAGSVASTGLRMIATRAALNFVMSSLLNR